MILAINLFLASVVLYLEITYMTKAKYEIVEHLVTEAQEGDRAAFSKIVRLMMNRTVAMIYKMTGEYDTAKDLAQDTFIAAWENLAGFRHNARFESWLYRIAANKTLNYLNSQKGKTQTTSDMNSHSQSLSPVSPSTPENDYIRKQLRADILSFMKTLPPQQRLVFELRFYKQLSFNEISTITGRSTGTVKTHYREAVQKLRDFARGKGWKQ